MKKIIIFLITVIGISTFSLVNVDAAGEFSFYEGDYIQGIWITKEKGGTKYYQKARFFMMKNTNQFAYCIEPFAMFNEDSSYTRSLTASNLSQQQMKRISLIAYFGYVYGSHYDPKWYAVSQYMIWKEADPSSDIYFTDGLNGNRITAYTNEINEINNLINNYLTIPSIANTEATIVEGHSITLTDTNNVLSHYTSDDPNVSIEGNQITVENLQEGEHTIHLTRDSKRTTMIPFFYHSDTSQDMTTLGDVDDIQISFKVHVKKTSLEITKIDKDNQDTVPSGEGSLSGAIYQLYDKDMNELEQLTIDEDMQTKIENLDFGTYYLKEIKAGVGYKLDEELHEFAIDQDNLDISLTLENEIIKKKVEINKSYGDGTQSNKESGINFDIFNHKNELYMTITTDSNGYACVYLPYGKYLIKQRNSTPGYGFNDDFHINVYDEEPIKYNLYDYKIKVPNTEKNNNYYSLIFIILGGFYVKKRIFN